MRSWLKARTAREMGIAEAAWLAGLIDGEGSVCRYMVRGKYPTWVLQVANSDRGALEYCQQITGTGGIIQKPISILGTKPAYIWQVAAQRNVLAILEQVIPYLQIKREVAEAFVADWNDLDGV